MREPHGDVSAADAIASGVPVDSSVVIADDGTRNKRGIVSALLIVLAVIVTRIQSTGGGVTSSASLPPPSAAVAPGTAVARNITTAGVMVTRRTVGGDAPRGVNGTLVTFQVMSREKLVDCLHADAFRRPARQRRERWVRIAHHGDSHGRQVMESLWHRLTTDGTDPDDVSSVRRSTAGGVWRAPKHASWRKYTGFGPELRVEVNNQFTGAVRMGKKMPITEESEPVHLLTSRGPWDVIDFATPVEVYAADLAQYFGNVSAMRSVRTITFKGLHTFRAPRGYDFGFRAPCMADEHVRVYRRAAACVVAGHNRRVANTTQVPVTLVDPWDFSRHLPVTAYKADGHHLHDLSMQASVVTDAILRAVVCPRENVSVPDEQLMWWSADPAAIEARFQCNHVQGPIASAPAVPSRAPPANLECRCLDDAVRLNDICLLHANLHYSLTVSQQRTAAELYEYLCQIAAAPQEVRRWATNLTSAFLQQVSQGGPWFTEVVMEVCVNDTIVEPVMVGAGYVVSQYLRALGPAVDMGEGSRDVGRCASGAVDARSVWCGGQQGRWGAVAAGLRRFVGAIRKDRELRRHLTFTVVGGSPAANGSTATHEAQDTLSCQPHLRKLFYNALNIICTREFRYEKVAMPFETRLKKVRAALMLSHDLEAVLGLLHIAHHRKLVTWADDGRAF